MVNKERSSTYMIAICDDEQIYVDNLIDELSKTKYVFDISVFTSGEDLLRSEKEFQVIFLDVVLGGIDGFQTAERLRNSGFRGLILFLTSYTDNFTEAFRVKSFRYLLKPLQSEKLIEALNAIEKELEEAREIYVVYRGKPEFIKCKEIVCIKALRDESIIYDVFGGEHMSNSALGSWKEELPSQMFFQVHKSYLIAMHYVTGLPKNGYLSLKGKEEDVPISKRLVTVFKEAFFEYVRMRNGDFL